MSFKRLLRIPKRLKQDFKIFRLAKNWKEILSAKHKNQPIRKIELRNGVVLNAPDEIDLNFVFHEIWVDEIYLPKRYKIKDYDIIFDIGGNIGVFSLYAATRASNVKVYSFEPFSRNADYFEQNIKQSKIGNVVLFQRAVAGKSIKRTLNVNDSWIKHTLSESNHGSASTIVECVSLDNAFANVLKCDLLKIDCEGSEYEIFYSSKVETIMKIDKIVGEFHNKDSGNENGKALCLFLEKNKFNIDDYYDFDDESGFFAARRSYI